MPVLVSVDLKPYPTVASTIRHLDSNLSPPSCLIMQNGPNDPRSANVNLAYLQLSNDLNRSIQIEARWPID